MVLPQFNPDPLKMGGSTKDPDIKSTTRKVSVDPFGNDASSGNQPKADIAQLIEVNQQLKNQANTMKDNLNDTGQKMLEVTTTKDFSGNAQKSMESYAQKAHINNTGKLVNALEQLTAEYDRQLNNFKSGVDNSESALIDNAHLDGLSTLISNLSSSSSSAINTANSGANAAMSAGANTSNLTNDQNDSLDDISKHVDKVMQNMDNFNNSSIKDTFDQIQFDVKHVNGDINKISKFIDRNLDVKKNNKILAEQFGLNEKQIKAMNELNLSINKYAKEHNLSNSQRNHLFFSTMASLGGYNGKIWQIAGGTTSINSVKNFLRNKLHLSGKMIDSLDSIKNNNDYDFKHLMGSLAVITNPGIGKKIGQLGTQSLAVDGIEFTLSSINPILSTVFSSNIDIDEAATFRGDIASGSLDKLDYMADVDALNISKISRSNDALSSISKYATTLNNGGNRADILARSYGLGDDNLGRKILELKVKLPPSDPGDLKLELGGSPSNLFKTGDDADKMWGYFENDFNKK